MISSLSGCPFICLTQSFSAGFLSFFWSDVYMPVMALPITATFLKMLMNPFGSPFRVTPKKFPGGNVIINWQLAFPLFVMLILYIVGFLYHFSQSAWRYTDPGTEQALLFWAAYSCVLLFISHQICMDVTSAERPAIKCSLAATLQGEHFTISGTVRRLSDKHAEIEVAGTPFEIQLDEPLLLELAALDVGALKITRIARQKCLLTVEFDCDLEQYRKLVSIVFENAATLDTPEVSELRGIFWFWVSLFRLYPITR
jgi:cellulose synthase (UDP-forming)